MSSASLSSAEGADLATSAWARLRQIGPLAGGATAAAAAAVTLTLAFLPSIRDPDGQPPAQWETGQPASEAPRTTARVSSESRGSSPPSAQTTDSTDTGPGVPSSTETTPPPPDTGRPADDSLLDTEVNLPGAEVDASVGLNPLQAAAGVDLDLGWVARAAGDGDLTVRVLNDGGETLSDLELDVQLSAGARVTDALSSTCGSSNGGLLGGVPELVRSVTCTPGDVAAGADAALNVPVNVTEPGQTVTAVLRLDGNMVSTDTIALSLG